MNFFAPSGNSAARAEVPHTVYQIDYASANCGKIVPMSKRHICFKFGYSNMPAMYDGLTGEDCRGAEHEVTITWSLSSGKQSIEYDGQLVYVNVCGFTDGKMVHSWHDKDGHYLKVIVHNLSTSLKQVERADWRQYDLLIDGVSYFEAPHLFELGLFSKGNAGGNAGHNMDCDDVKQPTVTRFDEPQQSEVVDLLSFDDIPVTPTAGQVQTVTPNASPHDNNAILIPFMGFNEPQQQYSNYQI